MKEMIHFLRKRSTLFVAHVSHSHEMMQPYFILEASKIKKLIIWLHIGCQSNLVTQNPLLFIIEVSLKN